MNLSTNEDEDAKMAVTVKKAWTQKKFEWHTDKDKKHVLMWSSILVLRIERSGKSNDYAFHFQGRDDVAGQPGFKCDGLSVPSVFRWFLPSWDQKNELYNIAGAVHDWLYATKGAYRVWTREECDDIFRGVLRISGVSRFKAGVADKAVELFAGNRRHWGNDCYGVSGLVRVDTM